MTHVFLVSLRLSIFSEYDDTIHVASTLENAEAWMQHQGPTDWVHQGFFAVIKEQIDSSDVTDVEFIGFYDLVGNKLDEAPDFGCPALTLHIGNEEVTLPDLMADEATRIAHRACKESP